MALGKIRIADKTVSNYREVQGFSRHILYWQESTLALPGYTPTKVAAAIVPSALFLVFVLRRIDFPRLCGRLLMAFF